MTYGQVILILFVVLIGYYGFLIFMDIQHLKAAEAAAQENQSEEEIDITDEARSFQPQQVIRDDKKKEEEKKQEEAAAENHRLRRIVCQYLFQSVQVNSKFRPVEFPHNCCMI